MEAATPSYGASGATLASFRRKYGPVEHTPLRLQSHSIGIQNQTPFTPRPMMKNSATSSFDLWNAGGSDFPSPQKRQASPAKTMYHPLFPPCVCQKNGPLLHIWTRVCLTIRSKSVSTPAFPRPVSRGPTFVNNSPIRPTAKKRLSGGEAEDGVPGIRRW